MPLLATVRSWSFPLATFTAATALLAGIGSRLFAPGPAWGDALAGGAGLALVGLTLHGTRQARRLRDALVHARRSHRALSGSNTALLEAETEQELLGRITRVIATVGDYPMVWVGLRRTALPLHIESAAIAGSAPVDDPIAAFGDWLKPRRCDGEAAAVVRRGSALARFGWQAVLVCPLRQRDRCLGHLLVCSSQPDAFTADEVALLREMGNDMAFGLAALRSGDERDQAESARIKMLETLESSLEKTVLAIVAALEARDPYTAGHQRRVTELALAIAVELNLPSDLMLALRMAGNLHDIGKIHLPAELLSRPGMLSPLEFELIKTHAEVSYEILKDIDFPWPIADIVRQHHERLDGSGYPQGLAGDAVLPLARILAVADVVEAMASHRPYRAALPVEAALAEIERGAGRWFDAAVVEACVRLFREKGYCFEGGNGTPAIGAAIDAYQGGSPTPPVG